MLGIGAIVGSGIFVLTGVAAAKFSGPALVLSFIIAGFACTFAALCYSEFAAMIPVAGSAYTYGYASLGEIWAWIIGWDLILEYAVAIGAVAIGWSGYAVNLLINIGIYLPESIVNSPYNGGIVNLPAMLIIGVISLLLIIGVKESARFYNVIVAIKIGIILLFIFLAIGIVSELTNIGTLAAFIIVSLGIIALRKKSPHINRPFKCPLVPFTPIISALHV